MSLIGLGSAALLSQLRSKQSELEIANHSLSELNRNLESRVAQRTTELVQANSQLIKEVDEREQAEQALVVSNQELERLAKVDGLTQIANRRTFDDQLRSEWSRLSREGAVLSLILFDIDFFKRYNDFYGHQAGDACLIQLAATVSEVVKRPADLVARYGGEEFAVILPETDSAGAIAVAQQIREAILQQAIPHELSDASDTVSVSVGVATCIPNSQERPDLLIEKADQALYRAKDQGRNRCSI
ncbi:diguanylate cyclase [bacterium]|nr:MAG: diguanylate cyclase [bacterium]